MEELLILPYDELEVGVEEFRLAMERYRDKIEPPIFRKVNKELKELLTEPELREKSYFESLMNLMILVDQFDLDLEGTEILLQIVNRMGQTLRVTST